VNDESAVVCRPGLDADNRSGPGAEMLVATALSRCVREGLRLRDNGILGGLV
jgi:hypothetical protein